jgi:hypothetical protein
MHKQYTRWHNQVTIKWCQPFFKNSMVIAMALAMTQSLLMSDDFIIVYNLPEAKSL